MGINNYIAQKQAMQTASVPLVPCTRVMKEVEVSTLQNRQNPNYSRLTEITSVLGKILQHGSVFSSAEAPNSRRRETI